MIDDLLWRLALSAESLPSLEDLLRDRPTFLDEHVDETEAARLTGRTVFALQALRSRGGGPVFHKTGRRVTYARRDLIAWLKAGRCKNTVQGHQLARQRAATA
jgi:hypothetical protein